MKRILVLGLSIWLLNCASTVHDDKSSGHLSLQMDDLQRREVAHDFFIRARSMELQGQMDRAFENYRIAYTYDSTSSELLYLLSRTAKDQNNLLDAEIYIEKLIQKHDTLSFEQNQLAGEVLLQRGKLKQAIEFFELAAKQSPDDYETKFVLANLYEQSGNVPRQSEMLSALMPTMGYPEAWVDKAVRLYHSMGNLKAAVDVYQEAWSATGNSYFAEKLAGVYETMGMNQNFHDVFDSLYHAEPTNDYYELQFARSYILLGQPDSALPYYQSLFKKYPDREPIAFTHATLLYGKKEYDKAKSYLQDLIKKNPKNAQYHLYMGAINEALNDTANAESSLLTARNLEMTRADYWMQLAYFYLRIFDLPKARALTDSFAVKFPKEPLAMYMSGLVDKTTAIKMQDDRNKDVNQKPTPEENALFNHAESQMRKALKDRPDDTRILFELGVVLERNRKSKAAIDVFHQLIAIDSTHITALNYLGYMLVDEGKDLGTAKKLIDKALKEQPDNSAFLDSKGWWYYKKGDYASARKYIEKSLASGVEDVTVLEHLALIFEKLGDQSKARENWQRILKLNPTHKLAKTKLGPS